MTDTWVHLTVKPQWREPSERKAMVLGFTGSRHGTTQAQLDTMTRLVRVLHPTRVLHGGCVGADATFDQLTYSLGIPREVYPAEVDQTKRGHIQHGAEVHEARLPLDRNELIVQCSSALLACPHTERELTRSGTWFTVRRARRDEKPIFIVLPNGLVKVE